LYVHARGLHTCTPRVCGWLHTHTHPPWVGRVHIAVAHTRLHVARSVGYNTRCYVLRLGCAFCSIAIRCVVYVYVGWIWLIGAVTRCCCCVARYVDIYVVVVTLEVVTFVYYVYARCPRWIATLRLRLVGSRLRCVPGYIPRLRLLPLVTLRAFWLRVVTVTFTLVGCLRFTVAVGWLGSRFDCRRYVCGLFTHVLRLIPVVWLRLRYPRLPHVTLLRLRCTLILLLLLLLLLRCYVALPVGRCVGYVTRVWVVTTRRLPHGYVHVAGCPTVTVAPHGFGYTRLTFCFSLDHGLQLLLIYHTHVAYGWIGCRVRLDTRLRLVTRYLPDTLRALPRLRLPHGYGLRLHLRLLVVAGYLALLRYVTFTVGPVTLRVVTLIWLVALDVDFTLFTLLRCYVAFAFTLPRYVALRYVAVHRGYTRYGWCSCPRFTFYAHMLVTRSRVAGWFYARGLRLRLRCPLRLHTRLPVTHGSTHVTVHYTDHGYAHAVTGLPHTHGSQFAVTLRGCYTDLVGLLYRRLHVPSRAGHTCRVGSLRYVYPLVGFILRWFPLLRFTHVYTFADVGFPRYVALPVTRGFAYPLVWLYVAVVADVYGYGWLLPRCYGFVRLHFTFELPLWLYTLRLRYHVVPFWLFAVGRTRLWLRWVAPLLHTRVTRLPHVTHGCTLVPRFTHTVGCGLHHVDTLVYRLGCTHTFYVHTVAVAFTRILLLPRCRYSRLLRFGSRLHVTCGFCLRLRFALVTFTRFAVPYGWLRWLVVTFAFTHVVRCIYVVTVVYVWFAVAFTHGYGLLFVVDYVVVVVVTCWLFIVVVVVVVTILLFWLHVWHIVAFTPFALVYVYALDFTRCCCHVVGLRLRICGCVVRLFFDLHVYGFVGCYGCIRLRVVIWFAFTLPLPAVYVVGLRWIAFVTFPFALFVDVAVCLLDCDLRLRCVAVVTFVTLFTFGLPHAFGYVCLYFRVCRYVVVRIYTRCTDV